MSLLREGRGCEAPSGGGSAYYNRVGFECRHSPPLQEPCVTITNHTAQVLLQAFNLVFESVPAYDKLYVSAVDFRCRPFHLLQ